MSPGGMVKVNPGQTPSPEGGSLREGGHFKLVGNFRKSSRSAPDYWGILTRL